MQHTHRRFKVPSRPTSNALFDIKLNSFWEQRQTSTSVPHDRGAPGNLPALNAGSAAQTEQHQLHCRGRTDPLDEGPDSAVLRIDLGAPLATKPECQGQVARPTCRPRQPAQPLRPPDGFVSRTSCVDVSECYSRWAMGDAGPSASDPRQRS